MDAARVRIGRIRLKNGCELRIIEPTEKPELQRIAVNQVIAAIDATGDLSGFAFVAWDTDTCSTCVLQTDGKMPTAYLPEFVKNRLLGEIIERWTLKGLFEA